MTACSDSGPARDDSGTVGSTLFAATVLVTIATVLGKCLSLLRDVLTAHYFGATAETDAFFTAVVLPATIMGALGGGLNSAVIPIATSLSLREDTQGLRRFYALIVQVGLVLALGATVAQFLLADTLVRLIAPGLSAETREMAGTNLRFLGVWASGEILYTTISALFHSKKKFLIPVLLRLTGGVAAVTFLVVNAKMGARGAIAKSYMGGALVMDVVAVLAFTWAFRYRPAAFTLSPALKSTMKLTLSLTVVSLFSDAYAIVERFFGSYLAGGSIACLSYGYNLVYQPIYLLILPGSVAALPFLSSMVAEDRNPQIRDLLSRFSRYVVLIVVPLVAFVLVYADDLIRLVYQRGAFDARDTADTALAMRGYALSLAPLAFITYYMRIFSAFQKPGPVILAFVFGTAVKIVLSMILLKDWQILGLTLATSAGLMAAALSMRLSIRKMLGPLRGARTWLPTLGMSILSTAAALGLLRLGVIRAGGDRMSTVVRGTVFVLVFAATYLSLVPSDRRALFLRLGARKDPPPAAAGSGDKPA